MHLWVPDSPLRIEDMLSEPQDEHNHASTAKSSETHGGVIRMEWQLAITGNAEEIDRSSTSRRWCLQSASCPRSRKVSRIGNVRAMETKWGRWSKGPRVRPPGPQPCHLEPTIHVAWNDRLGKTLKGPVAAVAEGVGFGS